MIKVQLRNVLQNLLQNNLCVPKQVPCALQLWTGGAWVNVPARKSGCHSAMFSQSVPSS